MRSEWAQCSQGHRATVRHGRTLKRAQKSERLKNPPPSPRIASQGILCKTNKRYCFYFFLSAMPGKAARDFPNTNPEFPNAARDFPNTNPEFLNAIQAGRKNSRDQALLVKRDRMIR